MVKINRIEPDDLNDSWLDANQYYEAQDVVDNSVGGKQIQSFEFYWQETTSQSGFTAQFVNSILPVPFLENNKYKCILSN